MQLRLANLAAVSHVFFLVAALRLGPDNKRFFFPPTPSWLPPGRSTRSIAWHVANWAARVNLDQEITPLPGIYFFDGWRVHPTLVIPANLPSTKEAPVCDFEASAPSTTRTEPTRSPEEEARDILATAAKNQAEDGPNTRRAAIRAYKYLRAMVNLTNMVP